RQLGDDRLGDLGEQLLLRGEVLVQQRLGHLRRRGHVLHLRQVVAAAAELLQRHPEQLLAPPGVRHPPPRARRALPRAVGHASRYLPSSARATERTWTSSGPSASRRVRRPAHIAASGVSALTPAPPCTWMARSTTSIATRGAITLIAATSDRAACTPCLSISQAVLRVSSRACSIAIRDSAICSRTTPCLASGPPNASRDSARLHISSSARSAAPIARMQWWMRPGPRRAWAMAKPPPSSPTRFSTGTRTSVNVISQWPCWSSYPNTGSGRTISTPGVSTGTSTI